jgi:hypothetical protein
VARSIVCRLDEHLFEFVDGSADTLVFTVPGGGPLIRSWSRTLLRPAAICANVDDITFHGLRHSFVAMMVAAGCNIREVSEWAGHNSVAFTLTRYGGLFEDGTDAAVDRLDALLGGKIAGAVSDLALRAASLACLICQPAYRNAGKAPIKPYNLSNKISTHSTTQSRFA